VNTLVSNVPGPPVPIYASGARVLGIYPCSIILEGMGVNTTVMSYCDRVDFGIHVDPDLVPNPWAIADAVPDALRELMKESNLGEPTPVEDPFGGTR
jgi:diacylglycerol O-acyltransferase